MSAVGALVDFDAFDIDLPTREGEWIGGGAALEVVTAALLAGSGLGHGEKYGAEALFAHQVFARGGTSGWLVSGGLLQRHRFSGRGIPCTESLTCELHHVVEGVKFLQLSGAEVTEKDGVGLGPDQERFC